MRDIIFFFNDTATTEIYTLSLHDALPIWWGFLRRHRLPADRVVEDDRQHQTGHLNQERPIEIRSEEHTSELQSHLNLVCRLLLEKKKNKIGKTQERYTARIYIHTHLSNSV